MSSHVIGVVLLATLFLISITLVYCVYHILKINKTLQFMFSIQKDYAENKADNMRSFIDVAGMLLECEIDENRIDLINNELQKIKASSIKNKIGIWVK